VLFGVLRSCERHPAASRRKTAGKESTLKPATAPKGVTARWFRGWQDRRRAARRIRGGSEGKPKGGTKDGRLPQGTGRGGGKVPDRLFARVGRLPWSRQARTGWGLSDTAPAAEFLPPRISAPDRACRLIPDRNPCLGTTFRSLETTARYRATFPRSKLLAYPFGSTLRFRRTRSITPLLHAIRLAPHSANSPRATRCPVPS